MFYQLNTQTLYLDNTSIQSCDRLAWLLDPTGKKCWTRFFQLLSVPSLVGFLRWLAKSHSCCSHSPVPPGLRLVFLTTAQKSNSEEVCLNCNQTYSLPFGQCCNVSTEYSGLKHVFHTNKSRYRFKCSSYYFFQLFFLPTMFNVVFVG